MRYFLLAVLVSVGCGANEAPVGGAPIAQCAAGESRDCECSDGSSGKETCLEDGAFGFCECGRAASAGPTDSPSNEPAPAQGTGGRGIACVEGTAEFCGDQAINRELWNGEKCCVTGVSECVDSTREDCSNGLYTGAKCCR